MSHNCGLGDHNGILKLNEGYPVEVFTDAICKSLLSPCDTSCVPHACGYKYQFPLQEAWAAEFENAATDANILAILDRRQFEFLTATLDILLDVSRHLPNYSQPCDFPQAQSTDNCVDKKTSNTKAVLSVLNVVAEVAVLIALALWRWTTHVPLQTPPDVARIAVIMVLATVLPAPQRWRLNPKPLPLATIMK